MAQKNKTTLQPKEVRPAAKRKFPMAIISVFAIILIGSAALAGRGLDTKSQPPADLPGSVPVNQELVIPKAEISKTATFYPVDIDGARLEVVAVEASDGTLRTAFNTCQVCYDSGRGYYKQQGNVLVCQNCGNRFSMDQVGIEAGGCNPWPISDQNKTVTDDSITISYEFLKESKDIFANWKTAY